MFTASTSKHERELHEQILDSGIRHIFCHICREQNLNLPFWSRIPMGDPGIVSFGHEVDIDTAIKFFGERCIIAGNINPAVIHLGTPDQIYTLCREALLKGERSPLGYILMPGCGVPPKAPPYHVFMVKRRPKNLNGMSEESSCETTLQKNEYQIITSTI
ncbi:MAG: uroporphyrinogen decarboxylase family protein [Deltaproteobacteria bacterium]|nr:uroporphyrinogen decarboxylase family protein [Deltaproteobacteria bacterium]